MKVMTTRQTTGDNIQPGPRRRHRRRRRSRAKVWRSILGVGALAAVAVALIAGSGSPRFLARQMRLADITLARTTAQNAALQMASTARKVYPYSVIAGGARTRQELTDAMSRDAVVASHYRSVSTEAVRSEQVKEDRLAYMSYRIGDKIYWTKNKIRLNRGETILTDGVTQIRARCGNCIAMEPMSPTSDSEPEAVQFDALTMADADLAPAGPSGSAGAAPAIGPFLLDDVAMGSDGALNPVPFGARLGAGGPSAGEGAVASPSGTGTPGSTSVSDPGSTPTGTSSSTSTTAPPITLPGSVLTNARLDTGTTTTTTSAPPTSLIGPDTPLVPGGDGPGGSTTTSTAPTTDTAPIPEPATLMLVGGGLVTLLSRRYAGRRKSDDGAKPRTPVL
jgi:PEP-CTERM motif